MHTPFPAEAWMERDTREAHTRLLSWSFAALFARSCHRGLSHWASVERIQPTPAASRFHFACLSAFGVSSRNNRNLLHACASCSSQAERAPLTVSSLCHQIGMFQPISAYRVQQPQKLHRQRRVLFRESTRFYHNVVKMVAALSMALPRSANCLTVRGTSRTTSAHDGVWLFGQRLFPVARKGKPKIGRAHV